MSRVHSEGGEGSDVLSVMKRTVSEGILIHLQGATQYAVGAVHIAEQVELSSVHLHYNTCPVGLKAGDIRRVSV